MPCICSTRPDISRKPYLMSGIPEGLNEVRDIFVQVQGGHVLRGIRFLGDFLVDVIPIQVVVPQGRVHIFRLKNLAIALEEQFPITITLLEPTHDHPDLNASVPDSDVERARIRWMFVCPERPSLGTAC